MIKTVLFFLVASFIGKVSGSCELRIEGNILFEKKFFSQSILFRKSNPNHVLASNESLNAYCDTGFYLTGSYYGDKFAAGSKHLSLVCKEKQLFYNFGKNAVYLLSCSGNNNFQLFESDRTLPGCEQFMTFGFGIQLNQDIIKAGLCYDLSKGLLKSLNYLSSPPSGKELNGSENIKTVELANEITDIDQYAEKPRSSYQQNFIWDQKFSFESIILNEFSKMSSENQNIFKVPFWTALWKGNWQLFQNAFQEHIQQIDYQYDIFSGVSGYLEIPQDNYYRKKINRNIPRYIWTFLRQLGQNESNTDSLVVIADNSPYFEASRTKLLCRNKCNKIVWLEESSFGRFHMMPAQGLMYCCNPKEVHMKLEHFPILETNLISDSPTSAALLE